MKDAPRLLIIDDDSDDRKLFIEAVKQMDDAIECAAARDGHEALLMLKNPLTHLPHFIFLDLRMPRLSGKRCLTEIRNDERLKHIPVIIYTTSTDSEESEELERMGAVNFISKPSDPEEIYYVVSLVLEEQLHALRQRKQL